MIKLATVILSVLVSLGLAAMLPAQPPPPDGPPFAKAKGKKGTRRRRRKASVSPAAT